MPVKKVHDYIDRHFDEHVRRIQEYLRQPSISSTGQGIRETAEMTRDYIRDMLGGEATLVPTSGNPVVLGRLKSSSSERTLFAYGMYDTQPAEPLDQWVAPPFEARVVEDRIVARGAFNTKGPLMALLNALKSVLDVTGDLPCNIVLGVEGEEELRSVHLPEFARKCREELKRCEDICMWLPTQWLPGEPPFLILGVKGIAYLELECETNPMDVHSSQANILPNPAWRLIWALNSMRGEDAVLVDGFYDSVDPPSPEEREQVDAHSDAIIKMMTAASGVVKYRGASSRAMARNLIFQPSPINIDGFVSGCTGPGVSSTIVPAKAHAKLDVRLVPSMSIDDVVSKIRKHLNKHGFDDVDVRLVSGLDWAKTSAKERVVQVAVKTFRELGREPIIVPMLPAGAPFYLFCREPFNMKMIMGGLGEGGLPHAPNEYLSVPGTKDFEKFLVSFHYNYAQEKSGL